ncbi:type IV pilus modification PilV family protein [Oceanimonas marisflavi]|uniref:type IV pilus modification PilV family protein n=1 Tax=Oceanimonas marisflavi TaxID=2059724 RepID=UPI000D31AD93|nr:prepilin-type N-terminal cleavage/methylation domain-containing protein [Oceanimonas marisflavi]
MKRHQGFGLVEALIAFVIVAVTAGALLQLNKSYLEYSRDGLNREVAVRLAESKLDEFRQFRDQLSYQNISGGTETRAVDEISYDLAWTVNDYGWDEANSQWVTPPPTGVPSDKKEIAVTVNWDDTGQPQSFTLSSVVSPKQSFSGFGGGNGGGNIGLGLGGPEVSHTPGTVPNVIPITLGDGITQETSRPLPKLVQQGSSDSLRVAFNTNAYDTGNKKSQVQDMATVACNCKLGSTGVADLPSVRSVVSGLSYWVKGETASKVTGVPATQNQDPLCTKCCANHFDGPDSTQFSHWYNIVKRDDDPIGTHYNATYNNTTKVYSFTPAALSLPYVEACRMVRINGIYEMANDWNLVALNIFDASLLSNTAVRQAYQDYVNEVVIAYILSQVEKGDKVVGESYYSPDTFDNYLNDHKEEILALDSNAPITTDIDGLQPGLRQLMARGIYVDIVSPEYRQYLDEEIIGESETPPSNLLKYVPFYEVNLTLLADWTSNKATTVASVSNEAVRTIVDSNQNYYGTYSRGVVNAKEKGDADITATIRRGNSGITAFKPLSPDENKDDDKHRKTSKLKVTVPDINGLASVSGPIKCLTYAQDAAGNYLEAACNDSHYTSVSVMYNGDVCGKTQSSPGQGGGNGGKQANNQGISYNCYVTPGSSATLSPSLPSGYESVPSGAWTASLSGQKSVSGGCLLVVIGRPSGTALPGNCT